MSMIMHDDDDYEEGSMFGPRRGSWWVTSKLDPRWNASGSDRVGGFVMSSAAKEHVARLTKLYGTPPIDLEFGYMKD